MKAFIAVSCLVFAFAAHAQTSTNVIVNITGNSGSDPCNSTLINNTTGFAVSSYAIGGSVPVSTSNNGGETAGIPSLQNLILSKSFSPCSAEITKLFLQRKVTPTLTLYDYSLPSVGATSGATSVLTITLTNAIITSYQLSDFAYGEIPQETISIAYSKLCIASPSANGPTNVCYNSATNTVN